MLTAVNFDHDPIGVAGEIGKVGSDRRLAPQMGQAARKLLQTLPKLALGFRRILTKAACAQNAPIYRARHA
jgi:hypothetical protein